MIMRAILLAVCLLLGHNGHADENPSVIYVDKEDKEMNAAIAKAQETKELFFKNFNLIPGASYSVKFPLATNDGDHEHIWFTPLEIKADTIVAQCDNEPRDIPDLKLDDIRELPKAKLSDWMIFSRGVCYGGYTIRVLAERDPDNAPPLRFAELKP